MFRSSAKPRPIELAKHFAAAAVGVLIGLAALEAMVRPFASVQPPPLPDIAHDDLGGPVIESRQLDEGVATSPFTRGGSRWTGGPPSPESPMIAIIGDSYVVAREVSDDQTMGAWVERFARDDGHPTTVRQYGWRAARPAQYVHVAPDVLKRWSPAKVVVILSDNDFDARALTDTIETPPAQRGLLAVSALAVIGRHRSLLLEGRALHSLDRWKRRMPRALRGDSRNVATSLAPPVVEDSVRTGSSPPPANIEAAVVAALDSVYGSRLAIVYIANVRVADDADTTERRLAAACAAQGVPFASTRSAMRALARRGINPRGFSTTTPGSGHLNVHGHEMVARLIWAITGPR
jgi:hypothetical protein